MDFTYQELHLLLVHEFSPVVVASVPQEWHRHKFCSLLVSDLRHPGVLPHVNFKGAFLIEAFGMCSGVPISLHLTPSKMTQHWVHAPKISGWKINCPPPLMVPFSPLVKFSPSAPHLFLSLIPLLLSPPVPFPPLIFLRVVSFYPLISPVFISPPLLCSLHSSHRSFPSSFSSLSSHSLTSPRSSFCLPLLLPSSTFPLPSVISGYITALHPCRPLSHTLCVLLGGG